MIYGITVIIFVIVIRGDSNVGHSISSNISSCSCSIISKYQYLQIAVLADTAVATVVVILLLLCCSC